MRKFIIGIVIVLLIIASAFLFRSNRKIQSEQIEALLENLEENTVIYTNFGFLPKTLMVKTGATVTFKNRISRKMWPASNIHPRHKIYPTTGGCYNSTFDACGRIAPGDSWLFTFDIPGSWKYHDHLNPRQTGTIIVEND